MTTELTLGRTYTFGVGRDAERGTVAAIDGDQVTVQWEQGVVTTQRMDALVIAEEEDMTTYRVEVVAGIGEDGEREWTTHSHWDDRDEAQDQADMVHGRVVEED